MHMNMYIIWNDAFDTNVDPGNIDPLLDIVTVDNTP